MEENALLGPVMVVYLRHWQKGMPWGAALKNPRFENLGGRTFIVGEFITEWSWYDGRKVAFAWDDVATAHYVESEAAYRARPTRSRRGLRRLLG